MGERVKGQLSRDGVVAAALALVQREGASALSVGAVARELGVYPRAVAWHIGGREDLLVAVVDAVFAAVDLDAATEDWRTALTTLGTSLHQTLDQYAAVMPLVQNRLAVTPSTRRFVERVVDVLQTAGLRDARFVEALNAYLGYVLGFPLVQHGAAAALPHAPHWAEVVLDRAEVPPDAPTLDASFRAGLEMLLDGMAARR